MPFGMSYCSLYSLQLRIVKQNLSYSLIYILLFLLLIMDKENMLLLVTYLILIKYSLFSNYTTISRSLSISWIIFSRLPVILTNFLRAHMQSEINSNP